ncbi:MAG: SpoIIE family protein phosphatase [Candidatus Eremiobacteraeota bacterium]|nr:SpoIIE family protein phosphatase [Candidatus Eremiobacteraeota bacterium]
MVLIFGLVAVVLPIALVTQLGIVRTLNAIFTDIGAIRMGQLAAAAVLENQLDEETGIRGYAATGRRVFLEPYDRARASIPDRFAELQHALALDGDTNGSDERALAELRALNEEWLRTVAAPILRGAPNRDALLLHGKTLIDKFRDTEKPLNAYFAARYHAAIARRTGTLRATSAVSFVAIGVIVLEVIVFAVTIMRMQRELDRERGFVESLQSVASVRLVPPPHLAIGAAYRSATRGTRVGGDVYDVYRLDDDRTLIVVGDVSGKGLTAAVETTFVRYALRTLASEGLGPAEIVRRFDDLYRAANAALESFVTLFVGIHDRRDGTLVYTNAGHEACWTRRDLVVTILPPTGPLVGIGGLPFGEERTTLATGDLLVLATDGMTEARDAQGRFAGAERVTAWIAEADDRTPQRLIGHLVGSVERYARGRIDDDLAVLAVRPLP